MMPNCKAAVCDVSQEGGTHNAPFRMVLLPQANERIDQNKKEKMDRATRLSLIAECFGKLGINYDLITSGPYGKPHFLVRISVLGVAEMIIDPEDIVFKKVQCVPFSLPETLEE